MATTCLELFLTPGGSPPISTAESLATLAPAALVVVLATPVLAPAALDVDVFIVKNVYVTAKMDQLKYAKAKPKIFFLK
jgi:hypothetical protein